MADDHDGVVIGREMAAARDADARRLAGNPPPSSLPATRYDGPRGDHRLYDPQRLPLDDELATFARRFRDMTDDARADTRAAMSLDDGYTLLAFARRAAVFALRSGDQAQVAEGLSACAAIELERVDQRDVLVALGLLHHAAHRCGAAASEMLRSAAGLGGPGFSALVDGFLAGSRSEHDLRDSWGLVEVDGPAGNGLLRWGFAPWTPRHDLAGASLRVAEALRGDVYDVDDPELATKLPAVWLSDPGDRSAEEVLDASRGAAVIHARLRAEASVDHASQQLTAWLVELRDEDSTAHLEQLARTPRLDSSLVGIADGSLFVLLVARSFVQGIAAYENEVSLARFEPRVRRALAGWASQPSGASGAGS